MCAYHVGLFERNKVRGEGGGGGVPGFALQRTHTVVVNLIPDNLT